MIFRCKSDGKSKRIGLGIGTKQIKQQLEEKKAEKRLLRKPCTMAVLAATVHQGAWFSQYALLTIHTSVR